MPLEMLRRKLFGMSKNDISRNRYCKRMDKHLESESNYLQELTNDFERSNSESEKNFIIKEIHKTHNEMLKINREMNRDCV